MKHHGHKKIMRKAVFLDKDGTIIKNVPYNVDSRKIEFTKNAALTLALLKKKGYLLIVTTNQSGIEKRLFTKKELKRVFGTIQKELIKWNVKIDAFYFCPHFKKQCECRKPKIGMITAAKRDLDINIEKSWIVGDSLDDIVAGKNAGLKTILYFNGENSYLKSNQIQPDHIVRNFLQILNLIK